MYHHQLHLQSLALDIHERKNWFHTRQDHSLRFRFEIYFCVVLTKTSITCSHRVHLTYHQSNCKKPPAFKMLHQNIKILLALRQPHVWSVWLALGLKRNPNLVS
jgi:hypothetical protein